MARAKPADLCNLERGKLIDAQRGFVETFNWMKDVLDDLTKGTAKMAEVTIVTGTRYDAKRRTFTMTTRKVRGMFLDAGDSRTVVFKAVAHSADD